MDGVATEGYTCWSHKEAGQVRKHPPAVAVTHPTAPEVPHG
jgi:hypothetical protein